MRSSGRRKPRKSKPGARRGREKAAGYLESSRGLAASYVFIAPLFAIYQAGLALDASIRNGTDPIFRELLQRFSRFGLVFLNFVVLGLLLLAIWRTRSRRRHRKGLYAFMLLESCAWAAVLLVTGRWIAARLDLLAIAPLARGLLASAGAGIYEEVLFRLFVVGGLLLVFHRGLGGALWWVAPVAILIAAVLFSQAHHTLGGEPWSREIFLYRAGLGIVLGAVFVVRGLGVVVYAHALYNVGLILFSLGHTCA